MRRGTPSDAEALYALIGAHQAEGHLLPRSLEEIRGRASRFVISEAGSSMYGCAELAPLSDAVAEVRSLVVCRSARGKGIGARLVDALRVRAVEDGHETLTAFTHDPEFFVRQGFSMVPHPWVPEKIARDCAACPVFRRCGQHAMVLPLNANREIVRYGARRVKAVEDRRVAVA
jgi:N-acetylglutamate synthase-like GNAT family acetyltransferase